MYCQIAAGVAGMGSSSLPKSRSASAMALKIVAVAGVMPLSPPPLTPSGLPAGRVLAQFDAQRRHAAGARHAIVHVGAAHAPARCRGIDVIAFREGLADALGQPAMHLAFDDQRIDRLADVVDRAVVQQVHVARVGIDFEFAHHRARGMRGHPAR